MRPSTLAGLLASLALGVGAVAAPAHAAPAAGGGADPQPGSAAYQERDARNIAAAYGRVTDGQLGNPAYLPALVRKATRTGVDQLLQQAAAPNRPALTPGNVFPGWNVGNPLRSGWAGSRGRIHHVSFTARDGALLRGNLYAPLPGARDPYTGQRLRGPFPGVVLTEGSVQGSGGMYAWLAEDLAERGYLVLTYDVQGQGESETFPHQGPVDALPFCNPFAAPGDTEASGCPGVPSQQPANFVKGTEDALDFFTSTPGHPYPRHGAEPSEVDAHNPWWRLFDRSRDPQPNAPGRTTRIAIIGHSLGAAAVSKVQGTDDRVSTVVALDKLFSSSGASSSGTGGGLDVGRVKPTVPALAVQSEYGFTVTPWTMSGGSSLSPQPSPDGPDPRREKKTGFDAWKRDGVDSMLVVPRASTHLEYTDIPLVLPASRYGQDLTSSYVQAWLDHYLRHQGGLRPLLARHVRYLEPQGHHRWAPVDLSRARLSSFYYCSAYSLTAPDGRRVADGDTTGVGC